MAIGKKTGGRKKGTPNKLTSSTKKALDEAFKKMGGVAALVRWGKDNPTEFYKIWVKILPVEAREADAFEVAELRRLQTEKLKAEIEAIRRENEPSDLGDIPDAEYTLTTDEEAPENPIL